MHLINASARRTRDEHVRLCRHTLTRCCFIFLKFSRKSFLLRHSSPPSLSAWVTFAFAVVKTGVTFGTRRLRLRHHYDTANEVALTSKPTTADSSAALKLIDASSSLATDASSSLAPDASSSTVADASSSLRFLPL